MQAHMEVEASKVTIEDADHSANSMGSLQVSAIKQDQSSMSSSLHMSSIPNKLRNEECKLL